MAVITSEKQKGKPLPAGSPPDDVLVVGAGASGMMAAIYAARNGARVRILEKMKKPGRKLLLTGNGRCNLTHLDEKLPEQYHSQRGALPEELLSGPVFTEFGVCETLRFFEEIGLVTQNREGYIYPASGQAQSVLNVLLAELKRLSVRMKFDTPVTGLDQDKESGLWMVRTEGWTYPARSVILSCGSCAGVAEKSCVVGSEKTDAGVPEKSRSVRPEKTGMPEKSCSVRPEKTGVPEKSRAVGSEKTGTGIPAKMKNEEGTANLWRVVKILGHTVVEPWPALTAMHCPDPDIRLCEGARTKARVTLVDAGILPYIPGIEKGMGLLPLDRAGRNFAQEQGLVIGVEDGELQWTSSELSGIPVFQLSRFSYGLSQRSPMVLSVDFFPDVEENLLRQQLTDLIYRYSIDTKDREGLIRLLTGFVHDRIAVFLIKKMTDAIAEAKDLKGSSQIAPVAAVLAAYLKRVALPVDGVRDFSRAQICIGGIPLYEVDPETLESVIWSGLYLTGEMLDIDGPCGGYNLQWAWSSGAAAGRAAGARAAAAAENSAETQKH